MDDRQRELFEDMVDAYLGVLAHLFALKESGFADMGWLTASMAIGLDSVVTESPDGDAHCRWVLAELCSRLGVVPPELLKQSIARREDQAGLLLSFAMRLHEGEW
jgi:hypothetical protein